MTNHTNEILDTNVITIPISVNNDIIGVYFIIKDITPLKNKEKEIRNIEEVHRALTDNVLDMIVSTNYLGEILYTSPSCQNILGYSQEELIGKYLLSLFHDEDYKPAVFHRKIVLTNQENGRDCYRLRKKDGSFVWTEILCKPVVDPETNNIFEVVSVIRDITEQKLAEEELRKRKKAFTEIIKQSPDGVVIVKNLEILFINETGYKLLGATEEKDCMHKSILDFIHPDYHQHALMREKSVLTGKVADFMEYKLIRLDGRIFDVEIKSIPTIFQEDEAIYIYIRDLTERKKTQELLFQAEKLNIAGQLAAGIAHEVRNPLTAIKGFLQLMESEIREKKPYFEIIQSEMGRIELILSELLALAKPKDLYIETALLQTLIHDVKTLIDAQAIMNNVRIDIHYKFEEILPIQCDKNQLKQVLINFIKNAIEAMKQGGVVTVETEKYGLNKIKIMIMDTGTGIPEHILRRIGEPFFTTKKMVQD